MIKAALVLSEAKGEDREMRRAAKNVVTFFTEKLNMKRAELEAAIQSLDSTRSIKSALMLQVAQNITSPVISEDVGRSPVHVGETPDYYQLSEGADDPLTAGLEIPQHRGTVDRDQEQGRQA